MQNDKDNFNKNFTERLIKFSLTIIELCSNYRVNPKYRAIVDQLTRSSTSIGANIVEAKASSSRRDYIKYFEIALKSANETEYWLILLQRLSEDEEVGTYLTEVKEISRIIGSSIITLKGKR